MTKKPTVVIAGLGPAGLTAAIFFAKTGWTVRGYEKLLEPQLTTTATPLDSRGYGFTFSPRGLSCLPQDLKNLVRAECHPISERVFVYPDGSRKTFPYGWKQEDKLHSLSRQDFLLFGMQTAREAGATLQYSSHVTDVNPISGEITYRTDEDEKADKGDLILGADGAFSVARTRVSALSGSSYSVNFDGVRFVSIALSQQEVSRLTDNPVGLHFFMSPQGTDVFIPTPPKGTLLIMSRLLPGIGKLTKNDATTVAVTRNRRVQDAVPDLSSRLVGSVVGHFVTTVMDKPYAQKCVIVGDAWKAMPAYAGQGVNAAVQDVADLVRMIDNYSTIETALAHFCRHRLKERQQLTSLNKLIGDQLLSGTYGDWRWRTEEMIRTRLKWRSAYQRLAFDVEEGS